MKVTVIGSGYVGLVSGACFADFGHRVTCVDIDQRKIDELREGRIPIYEPGLADLVTRNAKAGRLHFTTEIGPAVAEAEVVFIAVGTPSRRGDGFADLSYVFDAARQIAKAADGFTVVVDKSTVPVGTGDAVEKVLRETRPDGDFAVASNPEFLREGAAIEDFKRPDRVVIGVEDERAQKVLSELYRPLFLNKTPIVFSDRRTSELIKYAANAFLAMKITFINEMADLCEAVGADVQQVARGIGLDKRIGSKFLHAGPGYGGSCFPKDTLALARTAEAANSPVRLIETTIDINDRRKRAMARRIITACGGDVSGKTVAVLGLTFKPNTDDMRDAPSLTIVPMLQAEGATVRGYDPEGMEEARRLLPQLDLVDDAYECVDNADVVVLLTEWDQFRALDLGQLQERMRTPLMVDMRNIYDSDEVSAAGMRYVGIGRSEAQDRSSMLVDPASVRMQDAAE